MSRWAFKGAWILSFDIFSTYDSSVDCYVDMVIASLVDYFSWDSLVGRSFETTIGSSSRVSWVRDIQIIMILLQVLWFMDRELWRHATLGQIPSHHSFAVWRLEPCLQFDIQSHHFSIVWHLEPSFSSLAFRAISQSGIQSHHFLLVRRS